ncbi:MAG: hypothetical protein CMC67_05860 [Flavobacteriaceae bacterium]|jgi:hypothetical protein|nr:hypothetical protein [Flavobacteriaceae bacterium]|tara:strand:+ start:145 stop:459 length:315 start_codon:yes stop_codon:yes gene_type:complete
MNKKILLLTLSLLAIVFSCGENAKASSKESAFKKSTSKEDYLNSYSRSNNKAMEANFNSYADVNSKGSSSVENKKTTLKKNKKFNKKFKGNNMNQASMSAYTIN